MLTSHFLPETSSAVAFLNTFQLLQMYHVLKKFHFSVALSLVRVKGLTIS